MDSFIKQYIFILFFLCFVNYLNAQKVIIPLKYEDFTFQGQAFKHGSNYTLIGIGSAYDLERKMMQLSGAVSYQFRIRKFHFQTAYHNTSDEWFLNRSIQTLHELRIGTGLRKDDWDRDIAFFLGMTLANGDALMTIKDKKDYYHFSVIGGYFNVQLTYKFVYDMGVGLSSFVSINKYYSVIGINLHIYLSAAYKKEKKKSY